MNKKDLLALYLSGTYCHRTGTIPPSCVTPRQLTINDVGIYTTAACENIDKKVFRTFDTNFFRGDECN